MEEIAQRNIVFDIEIITLIILVLGVASYALGRTAFKRELDQTSPFRWIDLILMFIPAFFFLMQPLLMVLIPVDKDLVKEGKKMGELFSALINLGFFLFIIILFYAILEWIRDIRIVDAFGLKKLPLPFILLISILVGISSMIFCGAFLGWASKEFLSGVFTSFQEQDVVKDFRESSSGSLLVLKIGMACVAAPLAEELIFRGYIYGTLKRFTSPVFGAVISAGLFAAAHGSLPALFPLWGLAIILVISYEVTKCLWVPIGIHAFFNAANIILMLNFDSLSKQ